MRLGSQNRNAQRYIQEFFITPLWHTRDLPAHFSKRFVEPWKVAQKTLRWNVLFFFDAHAVLFCFSPFEWLPLWKVRLNRHALKSMKVFASNKVYKVLTDFWNNPFLCRNLVMACWPSWRSTTGCKGSLHLPLEARQDIQTRQINSNTMHNYRY